MNKMNATFSLYEHVWYVIFENAFVAFLFSEGSYILNIAKISKNLPPNYLSRYFCKNGISQNRTLWPCGKNYAMTHTSVTFHFTRTFCITKISKQKLLYHENPTVPRCSKPPGLSCPSDRTFSHFRRKTDVSSQNPPSKTYLKRFVGVTVLKHLPSLTDNDNFKIFKYAWPCVRNCCYIIVFVWVCRMAVDQGHIFK